MKEANNMENEVNKKSVSLPQIQFSLSAPEGKEFLLAAGGRPPEKTWLRRAAEHRTLWAIDRGLESFFAAGLVPEQLIGDGDSASPEAWKKALSICIPVERFPAEKDYTDTDLALKKIKADNPSAFIILTGGFGGRFDHAFTTMYSLLSSGLSGCLADEKECLILLNGSSSVEAHCIKRPKAVSLLPLSPMVRGVSFSGVRWPLDNTSISQNRTLTVSNRLADDSDGCRLSFSEGSLGLYFVWDEASL